MTRPALLVLAAALASAALLPVTSASACHQPVEPIWVDTPVGPVGFDGIQIPC